MKKMKRFWAVIVWGVALIAIAVVLLVYEPHQLWKVQQMNLFLNSEIFLNEQLLVAGGLLSWVGCWFTQMLYYPWLGVALLCGWWLALLFLMRQTFRIPDQWAAMLLVPIALLLLTNMDQGYWIYMLKLRGHFFVTTIGTTMVTALMWGFRTVTDKWVYRGIYLVMACAIGYPLMGIYGLAATLLMGLWAWKLSAKRTDAIILSGLALIMVVAVPLICYRYVYYQMNLANIWWAELPLFYVTEEYHQYYIPYYLLGAFMVLLVLTYRGKDEELKNCRIEKLKKDGKVRAVMAVQAVMMIVMVAGVWHFWFKDENFHRELKMQHQIYDLDWEGVAEEAATQEDEPTRAIVMMRNLALTRLGRQANQMFLYKNGSRRYEAPFDMRLMLVAGPLIYYQYGMLNYCNRLCMEMGVEFGFRVKDYQLLVSCALLENDEPLARKYIGILKQTLFYRDWAEQAEALLGHRDLIAKDAEREPITHMLHYDNFLGGDQGYTESFLMKQLARSKYKEDPKFQEQTLLATLWTKDVKQFWYHFNDYVNLHPGEPIPRYYQEAAYLYIKMEGGTDMENIPVDNGVKDGFERFATYMSNYDGREVEEAREGLYPYVGDTYYYDYYTMSNLAEY